MSPTWLWSRPAVSISTTSEPRVFAAASVSKATAAGSAPWYCLMISTPARVAQMSSCSVAAARNVSAAPRSTFLPARR